MKKLVVMLGAAAIACGLNAAQIGWGWIGGTIADGEAVYNHNGATAIGEGVYTGNPFAGTAYLILATDAEAFNTQLATDGTIGTLTTYGSVTTFDEDGMFAGAGIQDGIAMSTTGLTTEADQVFNILLVEKTADKTFWMVSAGSDPITPPSVYSENPQDALFYSWDTDTMTASSWSSYGTTTTPEPTSGMLILLGMAGLALRRKQKKA